MTQEKETLARPKLIGTGSPKDSAAEWLAYIQSGVANEEDIVVFKKWLNTSADNLNAYKQVAQSWEDVGLAAMVIELERECSASPFQGTKTSARPKSLPSRRWFVPAGIAASIALAIGVSVRTMAPEKVSVFQYATNVGEIRVVSLDDGSTVTLGASTMIEGRFSKQSREIELNRGRAFFDVTSDSGRPFRVAASKSQIEVVGTAFDVEYGPEAIQVSVQHGRVNVASVSTSPSSITAGMQLRASLAGINGEPTEFDINSLSWRSGRLAYIDARLEDVISEVNRYRSQKIQIADSEIEDLRVSFSIAADQTDVLLAGLEATLPIRVTYAGGGAILHLDDSR